MSDYNPCRECGIPTSSGAIMGGIHYTCLEKMFKEERKRYNVISEQNMMISQDQKENKITECDACQGPITCFPWWNGKKWYHLVCYTNRIIKNTTYMMVNNSKKIYNFVPSRGVCCICKTSSGHSKKNIGIIKTDIGLQLVCNGIFCRFNLSRCAIHNVYITNAECIHCTQEQNKRFCDNCGISHYHDKKCHGCYYKCYKCENHYDGKYNYDDFKRKICDVCYYNCFECKNSTEKTTTLVYNFNRCRDGASNRSGIRICIPCYNKCNLCDGKYNGLTFMEMYKSMSIIKEYLPKEMIDIIFEYMERNTVFGYYVCQSCIDNPPGLILERKILKVSIDINYVKRKILYTLIKQKELIISDPNIDCVCRTPYELDEKEMYAINTPFCPAETHRCLCFHGGYYMKDLPYIDLRLCISNNHKEMAMWPYD